MRRSWLTLLVVAICGVVVANRAVVYAQEDPGAGGPSTVADEGGGGGSEPAEEDGGEEETSEEPEAKGVSILSIVLKHSGVPGWIVIIMSVVALYLIARFFYYLRQPEVMPDMLIAQLEDQLEEKRVAEAVETCSVTDTVLSRVMRSALLDIRAGHDGMLESLEEATENEGIRLQQQVSWLSIIGAIAPMLGLTGTVLGMMGAFGTISQMSEQPSPQLLAEDIQLALTTTCEGLIVAVPVLLAYAFFRNRVTSLMLDVGLVGEDLLGTFKGIEVTPSMVAGVREAAEAGMTGGAPEAPAGPEEGPPSMEEDDEAPPPPPPE